MVRVSRFVVHSSAEKGEDFLEKAGDFRRKVVEFCRKVHGFHCVVAVFFIAPASCAFNRVRLFLTVRGFSDLLLRVFVLTAGSFFELFERVGLHIPKAVYKIG